MASLNRKAQEEMVGFVLIMVLVVVIFLIFLAIWLRQGHSQNNIESTEMSQFLDSAFEYTTDCARYDTDYLKVDELIMEYCKQKKPCPAGPAAGKNSCSVLNETLKKIVESAWNFGPDSPEKGYRLTLVYEPSAGSPESLINPLGQACIGNSREVDKSLSGNIALRLNICL
jgi:hypothetical protein